VTLRMRPLSRLFLPKNKPQWASVRLADYMKVGQISQYKRVCEDSSRLVREKTRARLWTVIALSPPVPFHLGKVKSSTSVLTDEMGVYLVRLPTTGLLARNDFAAPILFFRASRGKRTAD